MTTRQRDLTGAGSAPMWKFFVYSAIGAGAFFVPVSIGGVETIPLDHLVTWLREVLPAFLPWWVAGLLVAGAAYPFLTGSWRRSRMDVAFSLAKVAGLLAGVLLLLDVGPGWLLREDIGPFLLDSLVTPVAVLIPVGAVFLALLVGYGLMEYVGVLLQPVMRPLWRTPGRSAVDAVASFVGSYSLALLITDRVYREGRYTGRESAVIATGFSTISATFMIVVATTLDLMGSWLTYFWVTMAVTFAVTAITVRIPPLSRIPDEPFPGASHVPEADGRGRRLSLAWSEARRTVVAAPPLGRHVLTTLRDGIVMTIAIVPSVLSVGLAGLLLATYTPVFEWFGWVFYPITWALQLPDPSLVATAVSLGVAEMFLPALLVTEAATSVKFVVAVVSVSQIVYLSAMVPCVLSTRIPVSLSQMLLIWFERVVLSLIVVTPVALLLF